MAETNVLNVLSDIVENALPEYLIEETLKRNDGDFSRTVDELLNLRTIYIDDEQQRGGNSGSGAIPRIHSITAASDQNSRVQSLDTHQIENEDSILQWELFINEIMGLHSTGNGIDDDDGKEIERRTADDIRMLLNERRRKKGMEKKGRDDADDDDDESAILQM
jgi:hypothetical protein